MDSESVNTAALRRALLEGGGGAAEGDQPGFDIDNAIQVGTRHDIVAV